jgi:hypothetical protein
MRMISWLSFLSCLVIFANLGCDKAGQVDAKRVKVSGKITLDGKALATGQISFDLGAGQVPASLSILDGSYDGLAPVGKCKVTITSFRKISMKEKTKMDGPGYDTPVDENILPDRYSTKSDIYKEVTAAGPNEFNFDLKSK